ncbi:MAG TPA: alpha/beta hydrolase [Rhodoferax sp.]|nr:alpha/beta hydrolase [Rhodoferax sp.]
MTTTPMVNLSGGARLSFGETGAGPTIVMVHGSPGEGRAWTNVIKQLSNNLRILTPDLPGYGQSDSLPPETPHRTEAMASALVELAARQDGAIWLCGHSYGANVALHAAVRLGRKVAGLVLIEPVFLRALQLAQDAQFESARAFFTDYVVRAESSEPDAIGIMIDFWCGKGYFERMPEHARAFLNAAAPKNACDVRASFSETLGVSDLKMLDIPVVIVTGDQSPKIAESIATSCQNMMPNARTTKIHGATHLLLDTHAAQVAKLIEENVQVREKR